MENIDHLIEKAKEIGLDEIPSYSDSTISVKFEGGIQDFHNFIGPKIRNDIATITKKKKKDLGYICQKCNCKHELDAAHKHGAHRKKIIEQVLENYKTSDGKYVINDLRKTLGEIIDAHIPIEETFLFLCKTCHIEYDSTTKSMNNEINNSGFTKTFSITNKSHRHEKNEENGEILCENETASWKYKLGWTSMQNRKNIEELVSKIESTFDCYPLAFKSWYYHKKRHTGRQFSGIICHKNHSLLCFRLEPSLFNLDDNRIIRGKRWFFSERKEGRVEIIPQNYDLIMRCLAHAYDVS